MWRRIFTGKSASRIRKDAGELRIEDLERFPAWEFCLDEEDRPGQTECTVRPCLRQGPLTWPDFDGGVAADVRLGCGKTCLGIVWPRDEQFNGRTNAPVEILLPKPAQDLTSNKLPTYSQITYATSHRVGFDIAGSHVISDAEAKDLINIVYEMFGVTREQMWPLSITPRRQIADWPVQWSIRGWQRLDGAILE